MDSQSNWLIYIYIYIKVRLKWQTNCTLAWLWRKLSMKYVFLFSSWKIYHMLELHEWEFGLVYTIWLLHKLWKPYSISWIGSLSVLTSLCWFTLCFWRKWWFVACSYFLTWRNFTPEWLDHCFRKQFAIENLLELLDHKRRKEVAGEKEENCDLVRKCST